MESDQNDNDENNQALLVLVHDAWHGAWVWAEVQNHLAQRGWQSVALDLPGHGNLYQAVNSPTNISLEDYAQAVAEFAHAQTASKLILVGHGTAGPVCQRACELLQVQPSPAQLLGLILVSAFVLHSGEAIADMLPPEMAQVFQFLAAARPDASIAMQDLADFWRFNVMSDDMRKAATVLAQLTPEPLAPLFEKINLPSFFQNQRPCAYLSFNEDNLLPLGNFYPSMANKLGNYKHASVNTGHEGLLTQPREVAESLIYLTHSAFGLVSTT
jgi:alpha-beta hydrolase superfamily lysophospholipase